jgi:hypothetical protein
MSGVAWDFVYQAVLIALGLSATAAVVLQITSH